MLNALLNDNPGITIFGFKIYAYALCIVSGMIAAFFLISLLFKRRNMSSDLFMTYFCVTLPIAILTTRIFYCITDGMPLREWFSIESIRSGGLSIIGGILGGIFGVALVSYIKKVNFFRAGDCIIVGLLLAQAMGRWGNFANQEVYGAEVTNTALQCFPFAVYINSGGSCLDTFTLTFAKWFGFETNISGGTWHYAFFFYESLANLIGAILIFLFVWKNPKKPNGVATAWYFMHYGAVRSIMEPLRDPQYILSGGGVPWSLVFSLSLFVLGAAMSACVQLAAIRWYLRHVPVLALGGACAVAMLVLGNLSGTFPLMLLAAALSALTGVLTRHGGQRSRAGGRLLGQVLGFRQFLRRVTPSHLLMRLQRDPQYFYRTLPYAEAMGLGAMFARKFGDTELDPCEWYNEPNLPRTAEGFYEKLKETLALLNLSIQC